MRARFTCKDCGNRYPGCHDKCEKYQKEKAEHEARKAVEYQQRKLHHDIESQRSSNINKMGKRSWYAKYRNRRG